MKSAKKTCAVCGKVPHWWSRTRCEVCWAWLCAKCAQREESMYGAFRWHICPACNDKRNAPKSTK